MPNKFRLLLAFTAMIFFASCGKTNKQGKHIPKDALAVLHFNGESLLSKVTWEEIKQSGLLDELRNEKDAPPIIKDIIENPDNSGIDTKNDVLIYAANDTTGLYIAVQGSVKDATKFSTFNTLVSEGGSPKEKDGYNYLERHNVAAIWNKSIFIYVFDAAGMTPGSNYGMRDLDEKTRDMYATAKSLIDLSEKGSLAGDEKFSKLMNEKGDLHAYANGERIQELASRGSMGMMSMFKMDGLTKGNITTWTLNFENGKIDLGMKNYAGKEMTAIYKKYSADKINADMVKRFPGKDISFMAAFNFKPEGLQAIITQSGMEGLANIGLLASGTGITISDIIKANKGDLFFAAGNISHVSDTVRYGKNEKDFSVHERPEGDFIFSAAIGDKYSFEKIVNAIRKMTHEDEMNTDSANHWKSTIALPGYAMNDKYFALGRTKQLADQYLAGGNNDYAFMKKIGDYPVGAYANINSLIRSMLSAVPASDTLKQEMLNLSLKMWEDAYLTGGKMDGDALTMNLEVNLVDKSSNSLKQLFNYGVAVENIQRREMEKWRDDRVTVDSIVTKVQPVKPVKPVVTRKRK